MASKVTDGGQIWIPLKDLCLEHNLNYSLTRQKVVSFNIPRRILRCKGAKNKTFAMICIQENELDSVLKIASFRRKKK